jgi:hypothetical protein
MNPTPHLTVTRYPPTDPAHSTGRR